MPATKTENRLTERVIQINREMRDLCAEIDTLQARALPRVEEMEENFFNGEKLDECKVLNIFPRMSSSLFMPCFPR